MLGKWIGKARREGLEPTPQSLLRGCALLLEQTGEADTLALAAQLTETYRQLDPVDRLGFLLALNADFGPDPQALVEQAQRYARTRCAEDLIGLSEVMLAPRQRLIKRLARSDGGIATIVSMRETLQQGLDQHPQLQAFSQEILALLDGWFSAGILQLAQVDWSSPAAMLEKLIEREAVHAVDGWSDLRRRLQSDRRCFAFFHPSMPADPLIFVEVALLDELPQALAPLLDRRRVAAPDAQAWKAAAFYSVSHCHPGLYGVRLGHFLIRQVVQKLRAEIPSLESFCTLSRVPGFARWLQRTRRIDSSALKPARVATLNGDLAVLREAFGRDLEALVRRDMQVAGPRRLASSATDRIAAVPAADKAEVAARQRRREDLRIAATAEGPQSESAGETTSAAGGWLMPDRPDDHLPDEYRRLRRLCAYYLALTTGADGRHPDQVARFHLRNGASLGRINLQADCSAAGMSQSFGMMVNYVYDLAEIERNHRAFMSGEVICSREVGQVLKKD